MRPAGIVVCTLMLGFFCSWPAAAEEQLPINELGACEIVLHELIADLTRVQRTSRHESTNSRDESLQRSPSGHGRGFCSGNKACTGKIQPLPLIERPYNAVVDSHEVGE